MICILIIFICHPGCDVHEGGQGSLCMLLTDEQKSTWVTRGAREIFVEFEHEFSWNLQRTMGPP